MFVAYYVASIGRILSPVDKDCSGMVSGLKLACTGASKELSGRGVEATLLRGWVHPRIRYCVGFHAIA